MNPFASKLLFAAILSAFAAPLLTKAEAGVEDARKGLEEHVDHLVEHFGIHPEIVNGVIDRAAGFAESELATIAAQHEAYGPVTNCGSCVTTTLEPEAGQAPQPESIDAPAKDPTSS